MLVTPFLRLFVAHRALLTWAGRILLVLYFAIGILILVGRHWVLPEIEQHRPRLEQALTTAIGLPVKITAISAAWPGLHPQLLIEGLQVFDRQGRAALSFDRVEAEVGWSSLWHLGLRLHRLQIVAPVLDIRRDASGIYYVAGLAIQGLDSGFADWVMQQGRIVVSDARIQWHDELRGAPPLELQKLHFKLRNLGSRHSFGLSAEPPVAVAKVLDLRGNLIGSDLSDLASWRGELYADLEQADLSAWSPWLDLPLEWKQGLGDLRLWLGFENLQPNGVTADVRLADVKLRLRSDLPGLTLNHLEGRLIGRRIDDGYFGEIKRLSLATADGIEVPPTDARLILKTELRQEAGEFRINGLDFGALAALAGHLPLPTEVQARLGAFRPSGRLSDLELIWYGTPDALRGWQVKGNFTDLALAAHHELPGFGGISGRLTGNESSGEIVLDSKNAEVILPAVFPEPRLALASLIAEIGWQAKGDQVELLLKRMNFANADATGEATGRYRYTGQGPGEIDLSAKLVDTVGNAVWRYMPLVVNKDARDWLQAGIVGGRAGSASLRLKGSLADFPFRDGKAGIFQVKGVFQGAQLNYAGGWPVITDIDGELLFDGVRMLISGHRAKIMGVTLSNVSAEIADLEQMEELLTVAGKANGPTQRFLDFIEASPVGARIEHFTAPMKVSGDGELDLQLELPLRQLVNTQVQGHYRFSDNQVRVLPELPLLTEAQGELSFSADKLETRDLQMRLFGSPVTADVSSASGGGVRVSAKGILSSQALRKDPEIGSWGLFEHLSGESPWRGSVTIKKPVADFQIESTLSGLSSSLPEPFNKSKLDKLPLKLAGRIEAQRGNLKLNLGNGVVAQAMQTGDDWRGRVAIGAVAVKAASPLPARGLALAVNLPRLDLDLWRSLLPAAGDSGSTALPWSVIDLKVPVLRILERDFHDVQAQGSLADGRWKIALDSREAQGQLTWDDNGPGRIGGHLTRLQIPAGDVPAHAGGSNEAPDTLPAVDLLIDSFRVRDKMLGELRIKAENREGAWQTHAELRNDAARLSGEGSWRPSRTNPETTLAFKLDVSDAEKLIGRLGLPDAVRRGEAKLEGDLRWQAAPVTLDLLSLTGRLKLDAGKGQFKKLEPGVGRLLGVLSLQSLPRRITLDFRDIFSDGFAFDSISGEAQIDRGLISSDELKIRGPAAKVLLSGQANLLAETQDLRVRVQPAIGESIAVGAMLAHPVAGAVAWAAQKLLNDPLDQAFSYEYKVTGPWSDPKVEKVTATPTPPQKAGTP